MTNIAQGALAERLQITEREWRIVESILAAHLAGKAVWAFGSRATGKRVKQFSDLDLAVGGRLDWATRAALNEAFDEALINFKVDVVELEMVDADFRKRVEKDFLVVQDGVDGHFV